MRETCKKREGMNTSYGRIYSFCWARTLLLFSTKRKKERKEGKKRLGGLIELFIRIGKDRCGVMCEEIRSIRGLIIKWKDRKGGW